MIHLFVCTVAVWAKFHFFFRFLIVFLDFSKLFYSSLFLDVEPTIRLFFPVPLLVSARSLRPHDHLLPPERPVFFEVWGQRQKSEWKGFWQVGFNVIHLFPIETIAATPPWRSVDSRKMEQKMAKRQRRRKLPRKSFCGGFFPLIHARKKLTILIQANRYSPFLRVLVYCWWTAIMALVSAICQTKAECRFRCGRSKSLPLSPTTKSEGSFANLRQLNRSRFETKRDQIYSDHQP